MTPAGAVAAALLVGAAPAAASTTIPLHSAHRNTTAAGFATHSCDQIPSNLQVAGSDGFVFVLPHNDADFQSLSLSFRNTGGTTVTIAIPDASDAYPDGITSNGTSKAWVVVPAGWTLLDGSAVVSNDDTAATDFNLTHTCPGTPGTPTPSPSTSKSPSTSPSPSTSTSASPTPSSTVGGSEAPPTTPAPSTPPGGSLPVTGVAVTGMVVTGGALVAVGAVLLTARRRRMQPVFVADAESPAAED